MRGVMKLLLNLYKCTDDTRVINKTLTAIKTVTAKPSENVSILAPVFILDYDVFTDTTLLTANYLYCLNLLRYYYINDIQILTGGRVQISCSVDVLKTYADDIKNCDCVVTRSESVGKPSEIPDNNLPVDPNIMTVESIVFEHSPFSVNFNSDKCWLLTAIGGVDNAN